MQAYKRVHLTGVEIDPKSSFYIPAQAKSGVLKLPMAHAKTLKCYLQQDGLGWRDHEVRSKFTRAWPESLCAVGQVYTSLCFIVDHNSGHCGSHPEVSACFTTPLGLAQRLDGRALMMKVTGQDLRFREMMEGRWVLVRLPHLQFKAGT